GGHIIGVNCIIGGLAAIVMRGSVLAVQAPADGGQRAGGAAPQPPKNLKVLMKDTPARQVVALMRTFNTALGVQCGYCHVFVAPGDPTNDLASDAKTPKLVARVMMQLVSDINTTLAANINKPADQLT